MYIIQSKTGYSSTTRHRYSNDHVWLCNIMFSNLLLSRFISLNSYSVTIFWNASNWGINSQWLRNFSSASFKMWPYLIPFSIQRLVWLALPILRNFLEWQANWMRINQFIHIFTTLKGYALNSDTDLNRWMTGTQLLQMWTMWNRMQEVYIDLT